VLLGSARFPKTDPESHAMKVDASAVRQGNIIELQGKLWRVAKAEFGKRAQAAAVVQVELRNVIDGYKLNERWRSSEQIEVVRLEQREFQYLFREGNAFTFMDQQTFEQITLDIELIGEMPAKFLQDGMIVSIESHDEKPISVSLPDKVKLRVVEADAVVKGQTAAASYKPATLENGVRVLVPPHIEIGARVVISTADGTYLERAKD
jgi:elongation factor P